MPVVTFQCHICEEKFYSPKGYTKHYELHTNVSNVKFPCCFPNCFQTWKKYSGFKTHFFRVHYQKKPNCQNFQSSRKTCTLACCQKVFSSMQILIAHIKHHLKSGFEVSCPFENCSKTFKKVSSFTSHVSRKHKTNEIEFVDGIDNSESPAPNDIEGILATTQVSSDLLLNDLSLFYLRLQVIFHVPVSTIQSIVEEISKINDQCYKNFLEISTRELVQQGLNSEVAKNIITSSWEKSGFISSQNVLKTEYLRKKHFQKNLNFVQPISLRLGFDEHNKLCEFHYVPIKDSIKMLFLDNSIIEQFQNPLPIEEGFYTDFTDGSVFKNNPFFQRQKKSLQLLFYTDSFEVVNPLGSAKNKHKIFAIYFTLGNIHPYCRYNINPIQLVLLCKEKHLKYFGQQVVFKNLINDLKELENDGIDIGLGGVVKGSVVFIMGDNLGSHSVGGFTENFSGSGYICRFCESTGAEFHNDPVILNSPLRTVFSYNTCIDSLTGDSDNTIKASSSTSSETVCDVSTRENAHYDCDDISVESIDEFSNNWINGFNIPYRKFPSITLSKCENNEKISPGECREVVRIVCSEVLKKTNKPGKNNLEVIARSIVKKYPESFQNRVNSTIVGNGYSSFLNQLRARIENENRGSPKPAKRRAEESIRNFNARVNRDSYGCVRFLPDLSSNENEKTQNEKKDELKKLHDLKNWDIELVAKYMKETYVSQRISIIERNSIEEVIQEWPFLTQSQLFLEHFEELMDINIINKLNIACEQKVPELIGFLKSQRYAGKINFSVSEKPFSWTMMLCNIFEEEESCILLIVEDSSCLNEILQNQNNPVTPHIISFGDPYTLEAICVVVMEHESLSEFVNIKTALCMWFASFYVYNLKYPPGCAATLEFIQRVFLDINPGKGSKQMKQSGRRSDVNSKVLKLVNQLSHFKNMWSL